MLELKGLSKHFGGVRAVDDVDLTVARGRDLWPDRPQRLGQEHHRQSHLPACSRRRRARRASTARTLPVAAARARRPAASPAPSRTSACSASSPSGKTCGSRRTPSAAARASGLCAAGSAAAAAPAPRSSARSILRSRAQARRARRQPGLRRAAAARIRARAAAEPKLLLLDEPAAGMNAEEIDQLDGRIRALRDERRHHPADRASHGAGDVGHRPHRRPEFRPEDRRRHAGEVQADPVREAYLGTATAA